MKNIYLIILASFLFTACSTKDFKKETPKVVKTQKEESKKVTAEEVNITGEPVLPIVKIADPDFKKIVKNNPKDDEAFFNAVQNSKKYYSRASVLDTNFTFADQNYTGRQMLESLELFEQLSKTSDSYGDFISKLQENFDIYESKNAKQSALITGYYAPMLKGSLAKTEKYSVPLYPTPSDLVKINLKKFSEKLPNNELIGRINKGEMVPYFTRKEIDSGALSTTEPIAYLENRVDSMFLEIQGSGFIITDDGQKYKLGYAGKNGRAYTSIGSVIAKEKRIQSDKINMQTIREYLLSNPSEMDYILHKNESYVFFRLSEDENVYGNIRIPLTPKNSVAMDYRLIPKGSLVYIKTQAPYKLHEKELIVPRTQRENLEKFFLVQDTGGAITGGGRVDVYFGEGDEAFFYAGQMASKGEVYLIVAKKDKLQQMIEIKKSELSSSLLK